MNKSTEPETLCVVWLSTCQRFSFNEDIKALKDIYTNINPIVGAVAVKYPNNFFSVFIGIAMGEDEENDIAYIKSMGQRQLERIARAIFPQFDNMAYHS
jgi:hypothetical protein